MSLEGWYYLHTNGDLIYKRETGATAADIRDSDFARAMWPVDPSDRAGAWRLLVEAGAAGANPRRVAELAGKWGITDEDAQHYADAIDVHIFKDGADWCATKSDFVNLQECPSGFGSTCLEALTELCRDLDFRPSKMWGATFHDLVKP